MGYRTIETCGGKERGEKKENQVGSVPDQYVGTHTTSPVVSPNNSSRFPNQSSDIVNFQSSLKNAEIDIEAKQFVVESFNDSPMQNHSIMMKQQQKD